MRNFLVNLCLFLFLILAFISCANRGSPTGGEKDIEPPVIIKSEPENLSTNFNGNEIRIYFDEYIKFKDLQKQLIISPPMDPEPVITPLGLASKYISIKILDTLLPNTTYAINFGTSVVDNNESNPFPYLRYVFSTGDYIDSLSVGGYVKNSLEKETDKFISVMLYEVDSTYTDSIIFKEKPKYVTNTLDSTTNFTLENLKAGEYLMVALKEENVNFKFEPKTDKIGFLKEFISITADADSTAYELNLFKEIPDFRVTRPFLVSGNKIGFGYEGNAEEMKIDIISNVSEDFQSTITKDKETDTLYYWFKPDQEVDSLLFKVTNREHIDTLRVNMRTLEKDSVIVIPTDSRTLRLTEDFILEGSVPFAAIDESKITLLDKDSLNVPFTTSFDALKNQYSFKFDKTELNTYKIQALPEAFTDFFDNRNDTLNFSTRTKEESDYGKVRVNLRNAVYPIILQLVDQQGEVVMERYATQVGSVDFLDINPGKYDLRAIFDTNGNGKYDTGNYLLKQQPERVSYMTDLEEVRPYYEEVVDFILQ
jgi:uncharacterized protein (DUF2141 family)